MMGKKTKPIFQKNSESESASNKEQYEYNNLISVVMMLVVGPMLLLAFVFSDLKGIIFDSNLRFWLFYLPLIVFFTLKGIEQIFVRQKNYQKFGFVLSLLNLCSIVLVCVPLIYLFFFFWLRSGK